MASRETPASDFAGIFHFPPSFFFSSLHQYNLKKKKKKQEKVLPPICCYLATHLRPTHLSPRQPMEVRDANTFPPTVVQKSRVSPGTLPRSQICFLSYSSFFSFFYHLIFIPFRSSPFLCFCPVSIGRLRFGM